MTYAIFENTKQSSALDSRICFSNAIQSIIAYDTFALTQAFKEMQVALTQGYYLAGFIAYDAIFYMHPMLQHKRPPTATHPLLHFEVYTTMEHNYPHNYPQPQPHLPITALELQDNYTTYLKKFNQVQHYLHTGDTYELNLTTRLILDINKHSLFDLYRVLSTTARVEYAAYLDFHPMKVISISPELFFKKCHNQIITQPIKGTAPRDADPKQDLINYNMLKNDKKNITENLIVVDLIRNDLAKIAHVGSVTADKLFVVEQYPTVWQMVSTITASVDTDIPFYNIMNALFPSGSITGAPKLRTLELIDLIEHNARGLYTGTVGYILPNNDMQFNVAIRTLTQDNGVTATVGVGGGITVASRAMSEWEEIQHKIKFILKLYQPDFVLIESLLYQNNLLHNLDLHLARLHNSATRLCFAYDHQIILTQIKCVEATLMPNLCYKFRITLDYKGNVTCTAQEINLIDTTITIMICPQQINTTHFLFKHKTSSPLTRGCYDSLYIKHKAAQIDELIFVNQEGYITESNYFNVIVVIQDIWYTPDDNAGLLAGIYCQQLCLSGKVIKKNISQQELLTAQQVYLCNDVRGLIPCRVI